MAKLKARKFGLNCFMPTNNNLFRNPKAAEYFEIFVKMLKNFKKLGANI